MNLDDVIIERSKDRLNLGHGKGTPNTEQILEDILWTTYQTHSFVREVNARDAERWSKLQVRVDEIQIAVDRLATVVNWLANHLQRENVKQETPRVVKRSRTIPYDLARLKDGYSRFMRGEITAIDHDREQNWSTGTSSHRFADWARKRGELGLYRQQGYKNKSIAAKRRHMEGK